VRDLLVLGVPHDQVVEGIRRIKRAGVRKNLLEVLPLIRDHFAGVALISIRQSISAITQSVAGHRKNLVEIPLAVLLRRQSSRRVRIVSGAPLYDFTRQRFRLARKRGIEPPGDPMIAPGPDARRRSLVDGM
jgi:hypothetical protein